MSVITGFAVVAMIVSVVYMAYRMYITRQLVTLVSLILQLMVTTIAAFGFFNNVKTNNIVEACYIAFGVAVPCFFFISDYIRMVRKVKEQGVYEGLIEAVPAVQTSGPALNPNKKYINPILKERQVTELVKDINLNKDEILKNMKKSLTRAQFYINAGDYENAYEIYNPLVKLVSDCPGLFYNHGNICYMRENYTEAVQSYRKALEINDGLTKQDEARKGKSQGAQDSFPEDRQYDGGKAAAAMLHDEYMVYYNLGNCYFKLNKFEVAIDFYKKALSFNPGLDEAGENTARALLALGRTGEAIEYYKKLAEEDSKNYRVHYILGKLYFELDMYTQSIEELRLCIRHNARCVEAYETLGQVLSKAGSNDEAVKMLEKYVSLEPSNYKGHYNLGTAYYKSGQKPRAVECFKKVIELNPDNYKSHYNMAVAYDEMGQQDEAIAAFTKVIELKPDFIEAYNNLGILLSTLGRSMEALKIYAKGLKINPEEYSLYYNMGITLSEMGRHQDAAEAYKNALEIKPEEHEISYHLGAALIELKKYKEAVDVYKGALKVKPSDSELFYNLSIVYSLLRKHDIAMDNLKKALELNRELKGDAKVNKAFEGIRTKAEFKDLVS